MTIHYLIPLSDFLVGNYGSEMKSQADCLATFLDEDIPVGQAIDHCLSSLHTVPYAAKKAALALTELIDAAIAEEEYEEEARAWAKTEWELECWKEAYNIPRKSHLKPSRAASN